MPSPIEYGVREMHQVRLLALGLVLMPSAGYIQNSVFARPEIVYSTPTTVDVRYVAVGIQGRGNENEAMELISKHCHGRLSGDRA